MNDFDVLLIRFAWFGLGNLALAVPMAAVAWWVGRRGRPAITHALWVLVLLKLVTPPLGHVPFEFGSTRNELPAVVDLTPLPAPITGSPAPMPPVVALAPIEPIDALFPVDVVSEPIDWVRMLTTGAVGVWLTGAVVVAGWALVRLIRFRRLLGKALPAPDAIVVETSRLAETLGVSSPRVVLLPGAISPLLWVGFRAYLIVPADLLQRLDSQQRTALLLHELAHWRRGDHWVRRLETVVVALYWWCPLVWWAKSQLQQAEEECCDAWVVATAPDSVRAYALALVETVDFLAGDGSALPPLASGLGPFTSLRRRLTMMFRNPMPRMLTAPGLCGLGLAAALCLSWSPMPASVLAQERGTRKPAPPPDTDPDEAPRARGKERDPKDLQREVERLEKEIADTIRALKDSQEKERGEGPRAEPKPEPRRNPDARPNPEPRSNPEPRVKGRGDEPKERADDGRKEVERIEREIAETVRMLKEMQERARAGEGRGQEPRGGDRKDERTQVEKARAEAQAQEAKAREAEAKARIDQLKARMDEAKARAEDGRDKERRGPDEKKKLLFRFEQGEKKFDLQIRPGGPEGAGTPGAAAGNRGDLERRMSDVERKLDTIMWQLSEIRRGQSGRGPGEPPAPPTTPAPPTPPNPPQGRGIRGNSSDTGPNPPIEIRPIRVRTGIFEEPLPPPQPSER